MIKRIIKRIKETNIAKLFNAKGTIKLLEEEKEGWLKEKQALIDKNRVLNLKVGRNEKHEKKLTDYKKEIDELKVLLEVEKQQRQESVAINDELTSELFDKTLELSKYKIQCEEYEHQIKDLKSDRYLIKKIPSGRTPNTNKTKISNPMPSSVVRYMRNEYGE